MKDGKFRNVICNEFREFQHFKSLLKGFEKMAFETTALSSALYSQRDNTQITFYSFFLNSKRKNPELQQFLFFILEPYSLFLRF